MASTTLDAFAPRTTALHLWPPQARHVAPDQSLQRLRFHRGRSLNAASLHLEADNLEARSGLTCRALVDGVVAGFGVTLADQASDPGSFTLNPGFAIAPSGQDMALNRAVSLRLAVLPRTGAAMSGSTPPGLAGVGVLVIEPIRSAEARFTADADRMNAFRRDQQLDPGAAPFIDERLVDGVRISLVMLEDLAALATAPGGRNRAAHLLAEAEAAQAPLATYARRAVALAMLGIAADGRVLWISRHAAARRGGGAPQPMTRSAPGGLSPLLRQSQVDLLLEELQAYRTAGVPLTPALLRHLPPAGVLPAPGGLPPALFPDAWAQSVSPLPMGQLDAVFAAAAALAPFDLTLPRDRLHWYVPVPDALYETDLLLTPEVADLFDDTVTAMETRLSIALRQRAELRDQSDDVTGPIASDQVPAFPPDSDPLPGEASLTGAGAAETPPYAGETETAFKTWWEAVPKDLLTVPQLALVDPAAPVVAGRVTGLAPLVADLKRGIDAADDFVDFGFTRVQAEIYRLRQSVLDGEEATKLATFPVLAGIAKGSNATAINKGLVERFQSVKPQTVVAPEREPDPVTSLIPSLIARVGNVLSHSELASSVPSLLSTAATTTATFRPLVQVESAGADFSLLLSSQPKQTLTATTLAPLTMTPADAYLEVFNQGRALAVDELSLDGPAAKRAAIAGSQAIPGDYQDLRTMTIAGRLETPAAMAARASALRIKSDMLAALERLGIGLKGLRVPLVAPDAPAAVLDAPEFTALIDQMTANSSPVGVRDAGKALKDKIEILSTGGTSSDNVFHVNFAVLSEAQLKDTAIAPFLTAMRRRQSPLVTTRLADLVLDRQFDPDPSDRSDEAAYFGSAVAILESVIALFRAVEQRVVVLRNLLAGAEAALAGLRAIAARWTEALSAAETALAEARHDVRAARALLAEETARVDALAAHRASVLADHVRIMVYVRPRHLRPHGAGATSGRLLPGVYEDPLPAALAETATLPEDLRRMMAILRDVPVVWFAAHEKLLEGTRTPAVLEEAFHWSAHAATVRLGAASTLRIAQVAEASNIALRGAVTLATPIAHGTRGKALSLASHIATRYADLSTSMLRLRSAADLGLVARQSWGEKRKRAETELSLNDLIEGGRDKAGARLALAELEGIERVTSALHAELRRAPAEVRLVWADRLSAYDGDPVLQEVSTLPGWFALEPGARSRIAALHGWLFRRMNPARPEALALMSDILQVAVLLAAHAETDRIITARLSVPKLVAAGEVVELVVEKGQPKVGVKVQFTLDSGDTIFGTVSDLIRDRAQVLINPGQSGRHSLSATTRILIQNATQEVLFHGR